MIGFVQGQSHLPSLVGLDEPLAAVITGWVGTEPTCSCSPDRVCPGRCQPSS